MRPITLEKYKTACCNPSFEIRQLGKNTYNYVFPIRENRQ